MIPDGVLVDDDVRDLLGQYAWRIEPTGWGHYVKRYWYDKMESGKLRHRCAYLHREIVGATERSQIVDHINGDTFDNRRDNLRVVNRSANMQNRTKPHIHNKSGFRGVSWDDNKQRWVAQCQVDGKCHMKRFREKEDAIRQARAWRAKYHPFSEELTA